MIKHIVFFKVKEDNKASRCKAIKEALDALPAQIKEIKDYEVGINEKENERAFDLSLISTFNNYDELSTYANHPKHLEAVAFIKENCIETKVVDYSI